MGVILPFSQELDNMLDWREQLMPKLVICSGKGGVGKTTMTAALASARASAGRRVLLLSVDPAHSLGDSLGMDLGDGCIHHVQGMPTLLAQEPRIGAAAGAARGGDHGTAVAASGADDPESIQRLVGDIFFPISEEMNIIQSLVMSWRMIREEKTMVEEIFVDGSPSGHMLRALSFPFRMHEYLGRLGKMVAAVRKAVIFDAKRREMLDRRAAMAVTFNSFMSVLSQPAISTTILVSIPETMALAETWRTLLSLDELKVPVSNLILNKIHDRDGTSKTCCPFCNERIQNEASIIAETEARARARNLAFTRVPLLAREIHGIPALVSLGRQLLDQGRDACPEITTKASLF